MKNRYFFMMAEDQKILGPFPAATLDRMYRNKTLSGETLLSTDKVNWKPLAELFYEYENQVQDSPEPVPSPEQVPPPPPEIPLSPDDAPLPKFPQSNTGTKPEITKEDPLRIIGTTLNLLWNAQEKQEELVRLSDKRIWSTVMPVCVLFPLLTDVGAALSTAFFFGGTLRKVLYVLTAFVSHLLLNLLCVVIFYKSTARPPEEKAKTALFTGMIVLNSGTLFCIGILNYGISTLAKGAVPPWGEWSYGILAFLLFAFFCVNFTLGVRKMLETLFSLSPRCALWGSALFLTLNLGIWKVAELAVAKII